MTEEIEIIDRISAPVFELKSGRDGVFLVWNRSLAHITGIAPKDAIGRTPVEVLGPQAAAISMSPPGIMHIGGLGLVVLERHDDKLIGTLQDRERDAFIGMAAHDLRAPLRNVLFLAELALSEQGKSAQLLERMANVARNGLDLTNDLVSYAQSLGMGEQPFSDVSLRQTVLQILSTLDETPEVTCRDVHLLAEKPLILSVLRNLLDNAVRHGHATRSVRIDTRQVGNFIEIRVSDNGRGFTDSAMAFLSGGEFRVESGYGLLGLRRLLHARHGKIGVEPATNEKGSAVVVTLPGSIVQSDQIAAAS